MDISPVLMGLSIYILVWEKLPDWGSWFNNIIDRLPAPLAYLYEAWRCPYCSGFWIALALHGLTGIYTLPALAEVSLAIDHPAWIYQTAASGLIIFLDALATALLIMVGSLLIKAISGPAIKGHKMTMEFKASKAQAMKTRQ